MGKALLFFGMEGNGVIIIITMGIELHFYPTMI